jgi:hypothetical protein
MISTMLTRHMDATESRASFFGPAEPSPGVRPFSALGALVVVVAALPFAAADEPKVTIKGGQTDNPQFFSWTVTNRHSSPIVFIEFPHYHADTFIAPAGWAQDWKNRAMVGGGEDAPGWVRTSVSDPAEGIPTGGSAKFEMRLARTGALPRPGTVTVRFADGTEVMVANVEVPTAQSFLERNAMLIGLAAIFVIALLVHLRRRRTRRLVASSVSSSTDGTQ